MKKTIWTFIGLKLAEISAFMLYFTICSYSYAHFFKYSKGYWLDGMQGLVLSLLFFAGGSILVFGVMIIVNLNWDWAEKLTRGNDEN